MERGERPGPGLAAAGRRPRRRDGDEFRALLRQAARDPVAAAELTAGYAGLPPRERQALRAAAEEDAARLGLDVGRILACWRALDPAPARPAWRAWLHGERVVVAAPGRGAVEAAPGAGVRLHQDGWTPGPDHRPMEVEEAVDRFASMLWSARREGQPWPRQLGAFADLFDR